MLKTETRLLLLKAIENGTKVSDTAKAYCVNRSTVTHLIRRYGRATGGARVCDNVLLATAKNTTVLSSIRTSGECVYTTYSGGKASKDKDIKPGGRTDFGSML